MDTCDEDIEDIQMRTTTTEDDAPSQVVTLPSVIAAPPQDKAAPSQDTGPSSDETSTYKGAITRARARELKMVLLLRNDGPG